MPQQEHLVVEAALKPCRDLEAVSRLVGDAPKFRHAIPRLPTIARSDATLVVSGETGTGKELVARAVHYLGPRAAQPFVPINCGALVDSLLEDELFGHERGAFTDARSRRAGLLSQADRGTLFLDEIDSLTPRAQAALLRVLQDRRYRMLGGTGERSVDVRFVAATNTSLSALVCAGRFRSDLYYRLFVFSVELPPLRERPEDILLLAGHFVTQHAPAGARLRLAPEAERQLSVYPWPGNVRELENVIQRAVALASSSWIRARRFLASATRLSSCLRWPRRRHPRRRPRRGPRRFGTSPVKTDCAWRASATCLPSTTPSAQSWRRSSASISSGRFVTAVATSRWPLGPRRRSVATSVASFASTASIRAPSVTWPPASPDTPPPSCCHHERDADPRPPGRALSLPGTTSWHGAPQGSAVAARAAGVGAESPTWVLNHPQVWVDAALPAIAWPADSREDAFRLAAQSMAPALPEGSRVSRSGRPLNAEDMVSEELLAYLQAHPNAMDNLRGIADWWLPRHRTRIDVECVERALTALESRGLVERVGSEDQPLFRKRRRGRRSPGR